MQNVKEIVENPEWYCQGINLDQGRINFVKTTRDALAQASFLDQRFETNTLASVSFSLQELLAYSQGDDAMRASAPRFVFHTAFCCSTLLARCLDLPGSNLSLKEPEILMSLANYQRVGHKLLANQADAGSIYRLIALLLFRPFPGGETVVVKPTNTVNNIIAPLMATHADSRALLLHSDLRSFLISTLKKGEQGRGFARHLFNIFMMDSPEAQQLSAKQLIGMTDLQIAAITWHLQLEHFLSVCDSLGSKSVKSLHCDDLLQEPETVLDSLLSHFELPLLQQNFAQMLANAPLQKNAKTPDQEFSASDRKNQYQDTETQFKESLDTIHQWAKQLRFKYPYSEKIGNSLNS